MSVSKQLALPFATAHPKRRRTSAQSGVRHRARSPHCHRHPVHVTLRRLRHLPSMREPMLFLAMRRQFSRTARSWFRVLQFSVQTDHIHLIVEAGDQSSLSRGMTGLLVRLARALNRVLGRRGSVWSERFHSRRLKTPREVRNGLVYVLMNRRKHATLANGSSAHVGFDRCSSAWWFEGWAHPPSSGPPSPSDEPPVIAATTWLAQVGWRYYGLIRAEESPRSSD